MKVNLRLIFVIALMAAAAVSCTALERADILADAAAYSGAASASATDVGLEVAKDTLERARDLPELLAYVAGLIGVVAVGYIKRKFIAKVYSKAKDKIVGE